MGKFVPMRPPLTKDQKRALQARVRCVSCDAHHGMFVVKDELWWRLTEPGERRATMCIQCFNRRCLETLGRLLRLSDLKDVPANDVLRFVLED